MPSVVGTKTVSVTKDSQGRKTYRWVYLLQAAPGDSIDSILDTVPHNAGDEVEVRPLTEDAADTDYWIATVTRKVPPEIQIAEQVGCERNPENPLLDPPQLVVTSVRFTEEAPKVFHFARLSRDESNVYYGAMNESVTNSAWELVRGPLIEFDAAKIQIRYSRNRTNPYVNYVGYVNYVNSVPIWGFPRRSVRLVEYSWERKFYGSCFPYVTETFVLEVYVREGRSGWDRDILDEGTKVIRGKWDFETMVWVKDQEADHLNPNDFIRYKDPNGELARVVLDGKGEPAQEGQEGIIRVEYYPEIDFSLFGFGAL